MEINSTGALQENFLEKTRVSEIHAEIIAEEEKAAEALSAEELRILELKKQQKDVFAQMKALIATESGALHSSTHREKMHKVILLQKELLNLQQEMEGNSNPDANFFMDLALRVNSSLNQNGEMLVSESLKIADYMEASGKVEIANDIRDVALRAIESGYDVIKPEHIEAFK